MGGDEKANDKYVPTMFERWSCAAGAASIAECVTFPLEAMVIRLQLQTGTTTTSSTGVTGRRGLVGMLRKTVAEEGALVLWRGGTPAVWRQVVYGGIGIGFYPYMRRALSNEGEDPKLYQRMIAGATTGTFGQFVSSPLDVVKVRLQADAKDSARGVKARYRGMMDAFGKIGRNEGLAGYFRGLSPSLIRAAAQNGTGIATYDQAKNFLLRDDSEGGMGLADSTSTHVVASAISGFATAVAGNPADVLKTRMISQLQSSTPLYSSTWDCLSKTVRNEGLGALYKGFVPTYLRLAPWQITFFVCFEQISILVTGHTFPTK